MTDRELMALPCPFCGSDKVVVEAGSTFRWMFACCDNCDAKAGEVRKQTIGAGTPQEWHEAAQKRAIEEWNKRAQLAQPEPEELGEIISADEEQLKRIARLVEPEPVAWMEPNGFCATFQHDTYQIPLYTAPPQREWQGLTDEEVRTAYCTIGDKEWAIGGMNDAEPFARAIEAKLKEKNT